MYQLTNEEKGEKLNFAAGILIVEEAGGIVTQFES
jgi:fructose-1,6-bisphosphatase/inositol monophosphatase family enzyme